MLQQLFPPANQTHDLNGVYLDLKLHKQADAGRVYIYANYIQSLDGRISLPDVNSGECSVPPSIANKRDWRLYQELAGQADIMITSARYFRQLAKGCAQDLLPVGVEPHYHDIRVFREREGLKPQPDVLILSDSLDIPEDSLACMQDRNIIVLTGESGDAEKVKPLESAGAQVIALESAITGQVIRQILEQKGYKSAYMIAGPKVHHTLAADGSLDELFLTMHLSLLGGASFDSLMDKELNPLPMTLKSIYYDAEEGQLLMRYGYPRGDD